MTEFNQRRRNAIFFLVLALALLPGALAFLSTAVGISPKDPQFLDADYVSEFVAEDALAASGPIEVRSEAGKKLVVKQADSASEFAFSAEGTYLKGGQDTGTYPLFWIRLPPQHQMVRRAHFTELVNQLRVTDLTGLIGPAGAEYGVRNETTTILWSWTLGSQFSHPIEIVDASGAVVASGLYDTTCGILEELSSYRDGKLGTLRLVKTSFPMSRNRNFFFIYASLISACVLVYHFVWRKKSTSSAALFALETDLLLVGIIAVMLDVFIDIWFFQWTGPWGLLGLHLVAAGFVIWRFGFWGAFALFELFWAVVLATASRSVIPQLAFCPALIITWFALVQFQSFGKRLKDG